MIKTAKPDCLIIGAGIFGLWEARHAIKRGESVLVLDKGKVGEGASGGFLGSLMPHEPVRWNEKKQMQFEALDCLGDYIADLEGDTGLDCGYRMCGRIMPLRHEKMDIHVAERVEGMKDLWQGRYQLKKLDVPAGNGSFKDELVNWPSGWVNSELAAYGATYDNLSARVNPRAYLHALASYVREHAQLQESVEVIAVDPDSTSVKVKNPNSGTECISAGRIIIANGHQAYDLLKPLDARYKSQPIIGIGVKGQAVLVEFEHDDTLPIVYDDGAYIVPHASNRVAIGSTSLNQWSDAYSFDESDMGFYERAMLAVPALRNAPIVEKWAGVRPRNTIPDPVSGKVLSAGISACLDEYDNIHVAIGGFKIGLGIAHMKAGNVK